MIVHGANLHYFPSAGNLRGVTPKLLIGSESEFRDMNQYSGIGIVSLEFGGSPEVGVIA